MYLFLTSYEVVNNLQQNYQFGVGRLCRLQTVTIVGYMFICDISGLHAFDRPSVAGKTHAHNKGYSTQDLQ